MIPQTSAFLTKQTVQGENRSRAQVAAASDGGLLRTGSEAPLLLDN